MQPNKTQGASTQTFNGATPGLSLEDKFALQRALVKKQLRSDRIAYKKELECNLGGLEQVNLEYVGNQYQVYSYLTETHAEDQAAITAYFENIPAGDRVGWKRGALLGNDIFEAKIIDPKGKYSYEGRQSVIDFSKDEACQALEKSNPNLWNQYFYERLWSEVTDDSNNRWVPKLRLFQNADGKAYDNIKENFAKQDHIPKEVKDVVTPYLEQMGVVVEHRDQAYYNAVGANVLKIKDYDPGNNGHEQRAMKAGAAIKEFYGDWMTDVVTKNGSRFVGLVGSGHAGRYYDRDDEDWYCDLVLGG